MGTRNIIAVQYQGEYKIAQYGQWDGYPEGVGASVLNFLNACNIEEFKKAVSECEWATNIYIDEIEKEEGWYKTHPELSRDTGGEILELILSGKRVLIDSLEFVKDSLFCEWAYVVDLDSNTFEIYKGFNKNPLPEDARFYFGGSSDCGYYPVKVIKIYDIEHLPDLNIFISDCCPTDEEDDD